MAGRTITLSGEEAQCLTEGGYTVRDVDGRSWRLAHEAYYPPREWKPVDRHVSLSAAEVDIIARLPEGLIISDGTTIRSEVAA